MEPGIIEEPNKEVEFLKQNKGSQCSVNGGIYEKEIHNVIKYTYINNKQFNTQTVDELAGSSSKNDIECNFIEKSKNSIACREIFNNLINNINLYNGEIPPFIEKSITHEEWIKIKKETNKWDDKYIDVPSDSISKLYQSKGCNYIQISNGYGLYHLGNDICNFEVPLFNIEQQLRIRTKIHTRKNKKGFCVLSITIACQPKDISKLEKSKYSLDDKDKLPLSLIYNCNINQ